MGTVSRILQHLVSNDRLTRRLSLQSLLFATGIGAFFTGSAVFFTQVVGLSATEIGIGYSIEGALVLCTAGRLGRVADAIGPKLVWSSAAVIEGVAYLCYPLVDSFVVFLGFMAVIGLLSSAAGSARSGYTFAIAEKHRRVEMQAYLRTAVNVGLALGSLLGGAALLARSTTLVSLIPLATGSLMILNGLFVSRLPALPDRPANQVAIHEVVDSDQPSKWRRFGWRYTLISAANGFLTSHQTLLSVVVPLWLVTRTSAPEVLLGLFLVLNSLLAIALQVPVSRGVAGLRGAVGADVRAATLVTLSCLAFLAAPWGNPWFASSALVAGVVILTVAEVFQSAASWGLVSELAPEGRRSEFQGLFQQGSSMESTIGPALFTYLALTWGATGWVAIAGLMLCAAWVVRRCAGGISAEKLTSIGSDSDQFPRTTSA